MTEQKDNRWTEEEIIIGDTKRDKRIKEIYATSLGLTVDQYDYMLSLPDDEQEAYFRKHAKTPDEENG